MNGAESLVRTLLECGVDTCFANPGTSEMHFVAALDQVPGIRCILGLQENVVSGMADGYYRVLGRPAATLMHCGPGLANGIANLHNARRAGSGIVNIVGDHALSHRPFDSPLTSDVTALAGTVSSCVRTSRRPGDVGPDTAAAIRAARRHPGGISTLILPADVSWGDDGATGTALPDPTPPDIDSLSVETAASLVRGDARVLILLGGNAVSVEGQRLASQIADASGAALMGSPLIASRPQGAGRLTLPSVPYVVDTAVETLKPYDVIVLVCCPPPVGFFGYPGKPSLIARPDTQTHPLAREDQDGVAALRKLAERIGLAPDAPAPGLGNTLERLSPAKGTPSPEGLAATVAALLPENAIVVDEALTYGGGFATAMPHARPHDWMTITGGAIGGGPPVAAGAAIAGAGRRVLNLQADGSAAYTLQALWTQAREKLPCTTILLNNRSYKILQGEYRNVGARPGPTAMHMMELDNPPLNWVQLAKGMGVEAATADTMEHCADLIQQAFATDDPFLIDLKI